MEIRLIIASITLGISLFFGIIEKGKLQCFSWFIVGWFGAYILFSIIPKMILK